MNTAARIKEFRQERAWRQKDLAEKLGVDAQTISRWERGVAPPSEWNRVRLAQLLGVHPDDLRAAA